MDCPKCTSAKYCKDGLAKSRQRYLCGICGYRYTVKQRRGTASQATKRQALELYLEGVGMRAIGRFLKFSNVSILNWIKGFGKELTSLKKDTPVQVMELDELHTYISHKKNSAGYGWLLIAMDKDSSIAHWIPGGSSRGDSSGAT